MFKALVIGFLGICIMGSQTASSFASTAKETQKAQKKVQHYDQKLKKLEKNLKAEQKLSGGSEHDGPVGKLNQRIKRNKDKKAVAEKNLNLLKN